MSTATVVGLGEILWDVLPEGRKLGGAPANFAFHVNSLGGSSLVVSRVGEDGLGDEALAILQDNGLDVSCVTRDPEHPTGTVEARLDAEGVATYVFPDDVAWDFLELNQEARSAAAGVNAVCFGSLAQRSPVSKAAIQAFLRLVPTDSLKVFDVNLRQNFFNKQTLENSLNLANVLKVSDTELPVLGRIFSLSGTDEEVLRGLLERFELRAAGLTRGPDGSLLVSPDQVSDHPGIRAKVKDTIGAGDSFGAAMTLGLLAGWDLDRINERANQVAAFVCGQVGGMAGVGKSLRILL